MFYFHFYYHLAQKWIYSFSRPMFQSNRRKWAFPPKCWSHVNSTSRIKTNPSEQSFKDHVELWKKLLMVRPQRNVFGCTTFNILRFKEGVESSPPPVSEDQTAQSESGISKISVVSEFDNILRLTYSWVTYILNGLLQSLNASSPIVSIGLSDNILQI